MRISENNFRSAVTTPLSRALQGEERSADLSAYV
jgi:hypothetical protein